MVEASTVTASASTADRICGWFLHGLPPLSGPLRAAFYLGLLAYAALRGGPVWAPEFIAHSPPPLYAPTGIIGLFTHAPSAHVLGSVRLLTVVAWCCAGIGLFSRLASVVTALGYLTLYGFCDAFGFPHAWGLPGYALVALCFASCDDRWTADAHLARRRPTYWFRPAPSTSISRSGFPRALVTIGVVGTLSSAGFAKLFDAGVRWMDGWTIHEYLRLGRWEWLTHLMMQHRELCMVAAVSTMLLELGAPIAFFSTRARHAVVAGAAAFHVGIFLVMIPDFFPYIITYLLLVDWRRLARRPISAPHRVTLPRWAATVAAAWSTCLLVVALGRIDAFPVSNQPMFSTYVDPRSVGGIPRAAFRDPDTVDAIAKSCRNYCKWGFHAPISKNIGYRLAGNGCEVKLVPAEDFGGNPIWWAWIPADHLLRDTANVPLRRIAMDAPQGEAAAFVAGLADMLSEERFDAILARAKSPPACRAVERLEMTYESTSGPLLVAQARLPSIHGVGTP